MSWIVRVSVMEQIYKLVGEQSLEKPRHRWKENNKMFLERRMKRTAKICLRETVRDGKKVVSKYLALPNREKYFEHLNESYCCNVYFCRITSIINQQPHLHNFHIKHFKNT